MYNSEESSTYVKIGAHFSIKYPGSSHMFGYLSKDSVTIGGLLIKNQIFAEVSKFSADPMDVCNFLIRFSCIFDKPKGLNLKKGILGMNFRSNYVSSAATVFENLISQNLITKKVFSFYLNK